MLLALDIHNIVLIERARLEPAAGLNVLTGDTGAGKSIILDALQLALGAKGDAGLVRTGCDQASVIAEFAVPKSPALAGYLDELGVGVEDELVLRRVLAASGKSRAFINDIPVSRQSLEQCAGYLLEIQGQHAQQMLLGAEQQRGVLDGYAGTLEMAAAVKSAWQTWQEAVKQRTELEQALEVSRREEEYLRHAAEELQALNPQAGEEEELTLQRQEARAGEALAEVLKSAEEVLQDGQLLSTLGKLQRILARAPESPSLKEKLEAIHQKLDGIAEEVDALEASVLRLQDACDFNPAAMEAAEERLFALKAAARKFHCTAEELPELLRKLEQQLMALEHSETALELAETACIEARQAYIAAADALQDGRIAGAEQLENAIGKELKPLKMPGARFRVAFSSLPESQWGPHGSYGIRFEVATNQGSDFAAMGSVASGGELSRLLLACKVALASSGAIPTLVFDEIDTGIGGAVADAVGAHMQRLAKSVQVLAITHQPQVASKAARHFYVEKTSDRTSTRSEVTVLDGAAQQEEIARMLAGAKVTAAAREAAAVLLEESVPDVSRA